MVRFVTDWVDASLMRPIYCMILKEIHEDQRPQDKEYLRSKEEKRTGKSIEEIAQQRDASLPLFQISLHPARELIKHQPYLAGTEPAYCDLVLHAAFQWVRIMSDFPLLREDDRLHEWINRMDDRLEIQQMETY